MFALTLGTCDGSSLYLERKGGQLGEVVGKTVEVVWDVHSLCVLMFALTLDTCDGSSLDLDKLTPQNALNKLAWIAWPSGCPTF